MVLGPASSNLTGEQLAASGRIHHPLGALLAGSFRAGKAEGVQAGIGQFYLQVGGLGAKGEIRLLAVESAQVLL